MICADLLLVRCGFVVVLASNSVKKIQILRLHGAEFGGDRLILLCEGNLICCGGCCRLILGAEGKSVFIHQAQFAFIGLYQQAEGE